MEGGRDTTLSQIDPFPTTDDSDPGKNNYNVHRSHIGDTGGGAWGVLHLCILSYKPIDRLVDNG